MLVVLLTEFPLYTYRRHLFIINLSYFKLHWSLVITVIWPWVILAMCYHVCMDQGHQLHYICFVTTLIVQVNGGGASFSVCGRIPVGAGQLGLLQRAGCALLCLLWSAKLADGDVAPTTRLHHANITIIFAALFRVWCGINRPRRLAIWPLMSRGPCAVKQWQS